MRCAFDETEFIATTRVYEEHIKHAEELKSKPAGELTADEQRKIAELPLRRGEVTKMHLAKFQHDLESGQKLSVFSGEKDDASRFTTALGFLTSFMDSTLIKGYIPYLPELLSALEIVR